MATLAEEVLPTMRSLSPGLEDMTGLTKNNTPDMDLIEVLWKQDVDMGFSLEDPIRPEGPQATKVSPEEQEKNEKLTKIIQQKKEEADKIEKVKASLLNPEDKEDDPWAGLSYTVDTETVSLWQCQGHALATVG
ncbi:hypothetical protein ACJJTC_007746 [Scirpophaga incertulas]